MSVYWVAMWTTKPEALAEHDKVLQTIMEHMKQKHPLILTVRTWRVKLGSEPARPGYVWMEEFASLTSMDESEAEETTECEKMWARFHELIVPGTFRTAIWSDALRKSRKEP